MFIRAGFNKRFKTICAATIRLSRHEHRAPMAAYLVRFVPSGDLAWLNRYGIWWGERVTIANLFQVQPTGAESFRASPLPG